MITKIHTKIISYLDSPSSCRRLTTEIKPLNASMVAENNYYNENYKN